MAQKTWSNVDEYVIGALVGEDPALTAALDSSAAAGLPRIHVSPPQGKLLYLLARMQRARKILEIGTLGGYSTIWLARALEPRGRVVSIELEKRHADVARVNLARAGVDRVVDIRVGAALELLPAFGAEGLAPFDFVFIDADKPNTPEYFDWAVALSREGAVIVVDNVVRNGALADPRSKDPDVVGMRRLIDRLAADPRVNATILQTVGGKGYDGFAIAHVVAPQRRPDGARGKDTTPRRAGRPNRSS